MIRRSQVKNQAKLPSPSTPLSTKPSGSLATGGKPQIIASNLKNDDGKQLQVLIKAYHAKYLQNPKEKQVESCLSLIRKRDVFLLAPTGYGKSCIPELFVLMFPKISKPIVLVLNPLDTLGDDQVKAKAKAGFSAINLTQVTFKNKVADEIMAGKYQFVYVSPEIFLNSPLFARVFFSKSFQERLILKVVDKAHLIYKWGLATDGETEELKAHTQLQDRTPFRPSYGNLIERFLATETVQTLLMSATCTPKAISRILSSLKTLPADIDMHYAELTRSELRFIRMSVPNGQKSWDKISNFIPAKSDLPDSEIPPTLVYCRTQDDTYSALEAINSARGNESDNDNGLSTCVRRYHSITGPQDKLARVKDFTEGVFPIMTCTTALGMGQDWQRVRRVIVVGQSDPADMLQMAGRAGRDGQDSVAFLFVDPSTFNKRKLVSDFSNPLLLSDSDRMHAMAITPVCLRVGFAVDLKLGYFPLVTDDPGYIAEKSREHEVGMPDCLCSNCEPKAATGFIESQKKLTISNFDELIQQKVFNTSPFENIGPIATNQSQSCPIKLLTPAADHYIRQDFCMIRLVVKLEAALRCCFIAEYPHGSLIPFNFFFTSDQLWKISVNYKQFLDGLNLDEVFGSEPLPKAYQTIMEQIRAWKASSDSVAILNATPEEYILHEQAILDVIEKDKARAFKAKKNVVKLGEQKKLHQLFALHCHLQISSKTRKPPSIATRFLMLVFEIFKGLGANAICVVLADRLES